jgi:hypothetical protein
VVSVFFGYSNCGENWVKYKIVQVSVNDSQWMIIGINESRGCPTSWGPRKPYWILGPPFWEHLVWSENEVYTP